MTKRLQNTPKKYPNKGTGTGKNPRPKCPECGLYMGKSQYKYTNIEGKREGCNPNYFCICGYVQVNKEELKKIPD